MFEPPLRIVGNPEGVAVYRPRRQFKCHRLSVGYTEIRIRVKEFGCALQSTRRKEIIVRAQNNKFRARMTENINQLVCNYVTLRPRL